jgi:hypothetical protein
MALHIFQYKDTDIYALTFDRNGGNLPVPKRGEWRFVETLDPVHFAWGEQNFGPAEAALDAKGFFLFEGEMIVAEEEDVLTAAPKHWA